MTETFIHDEDLDLNDFTPAMRQFIEVKRRYPETLVLFRMGDFYETFFDDAAKANRLIGITLTKRGKLKNGDPIPMAGIPMVSLDQYVARLVRLGESVVIAEQLGTPGKGLMERRISRIITPGTLTDTSLLPEKDDAVLLSVSRPAGKNAVWGFAWLTLSNGDFFATEVTDEQFDSEVARISPSEVLVSEKLRDAMRETHPELTVTPMPAWHFDAEHGEEALKKTFGLDNLDAWGVTGKTGVLAAANALLDYTAETQVDMIPFISPLKLTDESEYIIIDPASRRNLEISDTIRSEGRGPTLFSVLDRCGTSMGSRELRRWLNLPLTKADEARGRHDALEALAEDQDFSSFVETRLQGLPDIERIASRIHTILPQTSVVGMLMEHEKRYQVVHSTYDGLYQHDGFSWQVLGTQFVHLDDFSREGKLVDETLSSWADSLNTQQREALADALYSVFTASGAKTLSELTEEKLKSAAAMLKTYKNLDRETRRMVTEAFMLFFKLGTKNFVLDTQEEGSREIENIRKKISEQYQKLVERKK